MNKIVRQFQLNVFLRDPSMIISVESFITPLLPSNFLSWQPSITWQPMHSSFVTILPFNQVVFPLHHNIRRTGISVFTWDQFWRSGIVVACVCVCICLNVRVSVNHELVCAIIHRPFKLGSPHFDQMCAIPWLRFLLLNGQTDFDLQS